MAEVDSLMGMAEISLREFEQSGAMKRDPYRMALKLLVAVVRLQPAVVRAITVAKHPLADMKAELLVAVREGAVQGASGEARYLGRKLDRRMAFWIGLSIGAAFVAGGVTVAAFSYLTDTGRFGPTVAANAAWAELIRNNPDPRPSLNSTTVQVDAFGRKFYNGLLLWAETPTAPPRR
jgi:hypothetical protein